MGESQVQELLLWGYLTVVGACIGSFMTVVRYRVPRKGWRSVVRPASACPSCGAPIPMHHNVPLLGWLLLRGKSACCRTPISVQYPAMELGMGMLTLLLGQAAAASNSEAAWLLVPAFWALAIASSSLGAKPAAH